MSVDALTERLRAAGCVFAEEEAALLRGAFGNDALDAATQRRIDGEPLEWILGWVDFGGERFHLSPGVFIPRQRSTLLVEDAVRRAAGVGAPRIVDLCCGCGALGLAVRRRIGGDLFASDLDARAVEDARRNGAHAEVGDLFASVPTDWRGTVDILLCNAPYVPTDAIELMPRDSRHHEDPALVDGGASGLDVLTRVVLEAPEWLTPSGHLHVECSPDQAATLQEVAATVSDRAFLVPSPTD